METKTTIGIINAEQDNIGDLEVSTGLHYLGNTRRLDLVRLKVEDNVEIEVYADELIEAIDRVRRNRE